MSKERGDELVDRLLLGGDDPEADGAAAYELLREIFAGYSTERLAELIHSSSGSAVDAGAWIVSELGTGAVSMLDEVSTLLEHPNRRARFHAIDAVHSSARAEHGAIVAKAVSLISDPDKAVRWRVLYFLTWATIEQLRAGAQNLEGRIGELTAWLANTGTGEADANDVLARLESPDQMSRLFAAAAAGRLAEHDRGPLERAAASTDVEIGAFAEEELQSPRRRRR